MSKLQFAMAMLAAGGAMGAASQASGAVQTETFDYEATLGFSYDIYLAGSTDALFRYHDGSLVFTKYYLDSLGTGRLDDTRYTTGDLPNSDAGIDFTSVQTYGSDSDCFPLPFCPTDVGAFDDGDSFFHLSFSTGGEDYLGVVRIDSAQTLKSISYDTVENLAVPEPASWALMIMGAGAAGAALRRARRRQPDAAAA